MYNSNCSLVGNKTTLNLSGVKDPKMHGLSEIIDKMRSMELFLASWVPYPWRLDWQWGPDDSLEVGHPVQRDFFINQMQIKHLWFPQRRENLHSFECYPQQTFRKTKTELRLWAPCGICNTLDFPAVFITVAAQVWAVWSQTKEKNEYTECSSGDE